MAAIINSGRSAIAQAQGNGVPLNIAKFVFANIAGIDPGADVDLNEAMPAPGDIVHEAPILASGYLSPDQVAYSTILGPDVGDFEFNWVGLVADDDTLIAVSYTPILSKYKTDGLTVGNTLTRNFLTQYNNAQAVTGITVPAEAWQIDFMARLNDVEEHLRQDMGDFFGQAFFFNNGFKITDDGTTVKALAGVGYVGGLRVVLENDLVVAVAAVPKTIYLDAHLVEGPSGSSVSFTIFADAALSQPAEYTLGNVTHYVCELAAISIAHAVVDKRAILNGQSGVIKNLIDMVALKAPLLSPALTGIPTAPTAAPGSSTQQIANTEFVAYALASLVNASPVALDTLKELANALGNDPNFAATVSTQLGLKAPIASPALTGTPTAPTAALGNNSTQLANTAFVTAAIAALVNGSQATLDTLNELATALGNDPNFATTMANSLGLKAPLASPALTGTPTAPTPAQATNTTQIATTAFVQALIALRAPLASPALTGIPTAPTAAVGNNSTQLANTAFVQAAIAALIDTAPGALNTLNELAAALGDDPNFSATITAALAGKAPLASPALTGAPTAPTAAQTTNNTQIATTAFVKAAIGLLSAVATSGNAADLIGTLNAARLPFNYGGSIAASYVVQRDTGGNILVPTRPINEIGGYAASTSYVSQYVQNAIDNLVDASPGTLNTLNELAAALNDDPNFATTMTNSLAAKAPLASPALTGTPTAPTANPGTNTSQIASTAFVKQEILSYTNGYTTFVLPATLNNTQVYAARVGHMVTITMPTAATHASNTTMAASAVIPEGYRPMASMSLMYSPSQGKVIRMFFSTNGGITIYYQDSSGGTISSTQLEPFTISFIAL